MDLHRSTFANCIDFLMGLGFDVHVSFGGSKSLRQILSHWILVWPDLWLLADDGDVEISNFETGRSDSLASFCEKNRGILTIPFRSIIRKQLSDVLFSESPEECIRHGVIDRIAVRMAHRAFYVLQGDSSQDKWSAWSLWMLFLEAMEVVSMSDSGLLSLHPSNLHRRALQMRTQFGVTCRYGVHRTNIRVIGQSWPP